MKHITIKELAQKIKEKHIPTLHDEYDEKVIDAMIEFGVTLCKKYNESIVNGYVPDATILEILGNEDTLNVFFSLPLEFSKKNNKI